MSGFSPFQPRPLDPVDTPEAIAIAKAAGAHGIYVVNALHGDHVSGDDQVLGMYGADGLLSLAYFGHRGNLIALGDERIDPAKGAAAIARFDSGWRIALGDDRMIGALACREQDPPLVDRRQVYYGVSREQLNSTCVDRFGSGADDVRAAERADVKALIAASLRLNSVDLNVDPWRVNKSWLRDSIKRRIREGRTFVIGPAGEPRCKLDLGSRGVAGAMVEGVYTLESARNRGLATRLVATVADRVLDGAPLVCLHVDADNAAARRAYEKVGMTEIGACRLLLRA